MTEKEVRNAFVLLGRSNFFDFYWLGLFRIFGKNISCDIQLDGVPLLHKMLEFRPEWLAEFFKVLRQNGGSIPVDAKNKHTGENVIALAVHFGNALALNMLILNGYSVDNFDLNLRTPLMSAITEGKNDLIPILLRAGTSINAKCSEGQTALHKAIRMGNRYAIQLLMAQEACDLNLKDKEGRTSLHRAVESGDVESVKGLVSNGADRDQKDNWGRTPLEWLKILNRKTGEDQMIADYLSPGLILMNRSEEESGQRVQEEHLAKGASFGECDATLLLCQKELRDLLGRQLAPIEQRVLISALEQEDENQARVLWEKISSRAIEVSWVQRQEKPKLGELREALNAAYMLWEQFDAAPTSDLKKRTKTLAP